jgi:centromere/kinetochore protein ZW10
VDVYSIVERLSSPINLEGEVHNLVLLLQLHRKLQDVDGLLDVGELLSASSCIVDMVRFQWHGLTCEMDLLEQLADMLDVTCDRVIFDMLKGEFLAKKARLKHRLDQLFCATITTVKKNHQAEISVSFRILSTHVKKYVENPVALNDVLCCMFMMDMLESKVRDLSKVLLANFVDPILADPKVELHVTKTKLHATLKLHFAPAGKKTVDLKSVWENLIQLGHFISTCMLPGEAPSDLGKPYVSVLANVWWNDLWQRLLQHLKPLIPDDRLQLDSFYGTHGQDLIDLNSKLQTLGLIPQHPAELSDFVMGIEKIFVKKQRNELLLAARDVLVTDDPNTVEVTHATERSGLANVGKDKGEKEKEGKGSAVGLESFQLPTMHVSERVRTVVEMAYQTLQEAVKQQGQGSIELYYCARDLFDLTRAVLPAIHGDDLDHSPGPALVFYNDCIYISHHLLTLAHQFRQQLPEPLPEIATFVDMVPTFRKMGQAALKRQLHRQRDALLASISSCQGFARVQDDVRFETVEQGVKQVVFQLTSLAKTWKVCFA